jgi:hypothetical protein
MFVETVTDLNKKFETDDLIRENEHGKWFCGPKAKFTTARDQEASDEDGHEAVDATRFQTSRAQRS